MSFDRAALATAVQQLAKHGVAHVYNSWTHMPPVSEQLKMAGSLLTPGNTYESLPTLQRDKAG